MPTIARSTFRKATYITLALSLPALALISLLIVGPKTTLDFATHYALQITIGYATIILLIEALGIPLRSTLHRTWAGALFALLLFLLGALAASATSMLLYQDIDPYSYIFKPLYWLTLFGSLPALLIGIIGSAILRNTSPHPA